MPNKFLGFLSAAGKDIVHVVEEAPKAAEVVGKLLADGVVLEPSVKQQIVSLMQAGENVTVAVGGAAASEGENLILDGAAVATIQAFVKVFLTAYPVIQKAAADLVADVKAGIAAPAAA
jgi:hypothetical protein